MTIPANTKFVAIAPEVDVNKRSSLINDNTKVYTLAEVQNANKYVARLTQTGTAAPAATIVANGLGKTITWTRTSVGVYTGTVSGGWGGAVVALIQDFPNDSDKTVSITSITTTTIVVTTKLDDSGWAVGDAILSATPIIIEVYPS